MVQYQSHSLAQSYRSIEELRKLQNPKSAWYRYGKLLDRGWFRLLVLEPSDTPDERMSCSLIHCPIDAAGIFEALSYVWGTDDAKAQMLVDGAVMCVRYGLYWALRSLRHTTEARVLWIDALCINQADLDERGSQVAQMVQIYSRASNVIAWFGKGDEFTDSGIECISKLSSRARAIEERFATSIRVRPESRFTMYKEWVRLYDSIHTSGDADVCFRGIISIFINPWWHRVWTLQEIVVARRATVQIGTKSVAWEDIETFSHLCTVYLVHTANNPRRAWSPGYEASRFIVQSLIVGADRVRKLRMRWQTGEASPLSLVADYSLGRQATDPRDKIYAILGMVNDGPTLDISYSTEVGTVQVYSQATRLILEYFGDLRAYGFIPHGGAGSDSLPSWVFNFQPQQRSHFTYLRGDPRDDEVASIAQGLVYNASAKAPRKLSQARMRFDNRTLAVLGVQVDDLATVGVCAPERYAIRPLKSSLRSSITQWKKLAENCRNVYTTCENMNEAFWRTVCADCKVIEYHAELTLKDNPRDRRRRLEPNDELVPPRNASAQESLISALDKQVTYQEGHQYSACFFTTTKGYFGLGPGGLRNGDVVVVLFGGEVPFALRPVEKGRYKMIGQCYLHGFMDGEAISITSRGELRFQDFMLE